jgi:hypothetical protein
MIDSDRSAADEELNSTKRRVVEEAEHAEAVVIVTDGREVENYVSGNTYRTIMAEFGIDRPRYGLFVDLMTIRRGDKQRKIDKIKFAHRAVELEPLPESSSLQQSRGVSLNKSVWRHCGTSSASGRSPETR